MEGSINQKRNHSKSIALSRVLRRNSAELIQIPVVDLEQLKNSYRSQFVKWETTIRKEHWPAIEKLILTERIELLRRLEKLSVKPSPETRWKTILRETRSKSKVLQRLEKISEKAAVKNRKKRTH